MFLRVFKRFDPLFEIFDPESEGVTGVMSLVLHPVSDVMSMVLHYAKY